MRKRIDLEVTINPKMAPVELLHFDNMICFDRGGRAFNFKRFRYRGVPVTIATGKRKGEFKESELILANRDDFIREIYLLKPEQPCCTFQSHFKGGTVFYLRYIDEFEPESSPFSLDVMSRCIKYFNGLTLQGIDKSKASRVRAALSFILKGLNRNSEINKLTPVPNYEPSGKQCAYDIELELKPLSRLLIRGYLVLIEHIKNETHPEIHPFYDENLFNAMAKELKWNNIGLKRNAFKHAMLSNNVIKFRKGYSDKVLQRQSLLNQSSRCALHLFYMWTGMNDSVLKKMKRSDVSFKSVGADSYIFESVKGRAGHKEISNYLGFSKYAKKLITEWLEVSKQHFILAGISDIDEQPFIPFVDSELKIKDFTHNSTSAYRINQLIEKLFPFKINATRFRKTKSDILMRVTEDMYIVSQGINNSINVVSRYYSTGIKSDNEKQLSATLTSLALIGKGGSVSESIKSAKILHSDILSNYDYKERLNRKEIPMTTIAPHGIRCLGDSNKKSAIERSYTHLDIDLPENEQRCTDFLSCFDCPNHILVASESDIWLMLSFYEQVIEMKTIPSQNSIPKDKLYNVEEVLNRTLKRLKIKAPQEYENAELKMRGSDHPLFKGVRGLIDTLEVFNV